jgi:hypothetical protein
MKKLVIISTLIATVAGTAFGQGYFQFTSNKSQVWDGFTTPNTATRSSLVNVSFLWSASTVAVPAVSSILASTPNTTTVGGSTWAAADAWAAILTDPNFTLALNANAGNAVVVGQSLSTGSITYNNNAVFGIAGTTASVAVRVFEIGWSSGYATPQLAQAGNSAVGWSAAWNYTPSAFTGAPTAMNAPSQFGTGGIVPEPSTIALAGLGGLSLLLFRRRK